MNKTLLILAILLGLGLGVYFVTGTATKDQVAAVVQSGDHAAPEEPAADSGNAAPRAPAARAQPIIGTVPFDVFSTDKDAASTTLIDVRTPDEYNAGHLPSAQLIDFYSPDFKATLQQLDKNAPYAIYCRTGHRSGQALTIMQELGFKDVVDLKGGIQAWQSAGKAICTNC